ncbi:S41 family peptidase [Lacibacter sediminis]|uniref:S41 family peptidase n=1 Tax=Lacibacter sediminis TaxID=2760713 RepID=A0A7G5XBE6_9BACT|nr:S41 family peptidase [Lacibacter sediminis]QNA42799.1 S41 family peptidase [Lacibacter sediminis]
MNKKKVQVWLPVLLSVSLIIGMFFGYKLRDNMGSYAPSFFGRSKPNPVQEILELVKQKYVDTVSTDSLGQFAIQDVLNQLDPHSIYIPPVEVQMVNEDMQGNYQGVGLEFGMLNDTLHVLFVMPKGPSEKAGLQVGDRIISANDSIISGMKKKPEDIRKIFRGPKGTEVKVKLIRNNKPFELIIQRGIIPIKSVDAAYMIEPGIAYVRVVKFSATTYEEFMQNLERLQKDGMKQLILDLRGNGGGMLDDAVQMADEFLSDNKEIVYTEGKSYPRQSYAARRPGLFEEGKLVLLIDEGSASASEVLAGALQDWDRATILGRRSFGKGLVQEQFTLSDGSAVRLTVSRYFTPIGRSIQKPYNRGDKATYKSEVSERLTNGELFHGDSATHNGKKYKTKGGRIVYGGGGISPDIYVAVDSADQLPKANRMIIREQVSDAAYLYFIRNRAALKGLKDPAALQQYTNADASLNNYINSSIATDSVSPSSLTERQLATVKKNFISSLSRYIWHTEGYVKMRNLFDPLVSRALLELKK